MLYNKLYGFFEYFFYLLKEIWMLRVKSEAIYLNHDWIFKNILVLGKNIFRLKTFYRNV